MNVIKGKIIKIQTHEGISLVKIAVTSEIIFTSVVIETPESNDYLTLENEINLIFKETEVSICKDLSPKISIQNQIPCIIQSIKKGVIFTQIDLHFGNQKIASLITTNACNQLDLKENDAVLAMIKSNEISLLPND